MDKPIIRHPDFWKGKLIPQFLSFEGLDEFIQRRVLFIKVFSHVYKAQFQDLLESKNTYDDSEFGDLYRRFTLIKGIFQGVNNKDDVLGSTADLLRRFAPGESADPHDYGIVSPTIWDVDFPRSGDKKRPFSDPEIGPENRKRLFNLLKAIQDTPDGWLLTDPSVLNELPFRIGNSLLSPLLFALNPRKYPITNQAVKDAISWLKGESTADKQSFILPEFPTPHGMKDYMEYAKDIRALSQEFVQLTAREDLDKKVGLGFLDAFFWWLQSHFAQKRVWVVAPCDSKAKDFDQRWQDCLENHFIAVGWSEIGDLSQVTKKNEIKGRYAKAFPKAVKGKQSQNCGTLWRFAKEMKKGDLVIARQGRNEAIGVGTVDQEYRFEPSKKDFKHVVGVNWDEDFTPRKASNQFGMQTVHEVTRLTYEEIPSWPPVGPIDPLPDDPPPDVHAIISMISEYRNIILYGPPGTGKTYLVREAALYWLAGANKISVEEAGKQYLSFVQFHPSYSYEDFIRGLTATTDSEGRLHYLYRDGLFVETCLKAQLGGNKKQFVLIIDEINRGDIPRIFGELMYLLEYRGRKYQINLQYPDKDGNRSFYVPENLHVIGTMNTADRSIALLDTALRRRFQFHEIMPDSGKITSVIQVGPSGEKCEPRIILENINKRIRDQGLREKQIGHSYFMQANGEAIDDLGVLMGRFNGQILPLLQEYFFDDIEALNTVVGSKFVNLNSGAIVRHTDHDAFWEALKVLLKESPKGSPV